MFLKSFFAFVLCSVLICESAFVDTLNKCSKDDGDCLAKLIQNVLHDTPKQGIEEIGIPSIDPAKLNFSISIPNLIDITFNGVAKGVRNTIVNKFSLNFEDSVALLDILGNILIKGNYSLLSSNPAFKSLFNGDIHGDGYGKIKLDDLKVNAVMPFFVKKIGDDTFLIGKKNKVKYSFDIGKATIAANNLYVGDTESSATIIPLINQEWKTIVKTYGKLFSDKALDFVHDITYEFCRKVPTKHYIKEDLSAYVTETE